MRKINYILTTLLVGSLVMGTIPSIADTKTESKSQENMVCVKTSELAKIMEQKGLFSLMNMTNDNGVVETVWITGQSVMITAQNKEDSCMLAMMKDVVYNPDTLQGLVKAFESQQKKQNQTRMPRRTITHKTRNASGRIIRAGSVRRK